MMSHFDMLLVGAHVVDPQNKIDEYLDIGIADGKVKSVKGSLDRRSADTIISAHGKTIIPGVIDCAYARE